MMRVGQGINGHQINWGAEKTAPRVKEIKVAKEEKKIKKRESQVGKGKEIITD